MIPFSDPSHKLGNSPVVKRWVQGYLAHKKTPPLCGRAPLGLAPHTSMCMGEESFTEENRCPHVPWAYNSLDVTCIKSLRSSFMGYYSQTPPHEAVRVSGLSCLQSGRTTAQWRVVGRSPRSCGGRAALDKTAASREDPGALAGAAAVQGYLAHKKPSHPRTLQ